MVSVTHMTSPTDELNSGVVSTTVVNVFQYYVRSRSICHIYKPDLYNKAML